MKNIPTCIFFFLFLLNSKISYTQHYLGVGTSYHFTSLTNESIGFYLPESETTGGGFSITTKPTARYSISLNYGVSLSPSFILFTGFQKIGFGQKFDIEKISSVYNGNQLELKTEIFNSDLKIDYLKVPIKLYWKHAKYKTFGTFLSLSFDFGYLLSAKLEQNSIKYDYSDQVNKFDVNYTLGFGIRYDTDKSSFNIGIAGGDGFSDVENKEKIGVTIQNPTVNSFFGFFASYSIKIFNLRSSQ